MKTPTLVITNELDYRVPVDQGIQLFTALRRQNVPSEMLIFPDEGHWVLIALNSKYWHEQVFGWMKRWLEATPATTRNNEVSRNSATYPPPRLRDAERILYDISEKAIL